MSDERQPMRSFVSDWLLGSPNFPEVHPGVHLGQTHSNTQKATYTQYRLGRKSLTICLFQCCEAKLNEAFEELLHYDLKDPNDFAEFLITANIGLVRTKFPGCFQFQKRTTRSITVLLANGEWIGCDWIFLCWKVTFPFQTLDFQRFWFFHFPSSEWIPMIEFQWCMSSQKFRAKGKDIIYILPLSTIWPCLSFNLRKFKMLFYSKDCLGAGTCTIYENPKTRYHADKKPTLQHVQMVNQLWSHMMSWKHGPKTQQGRLFAQYPMLGRHGSIRTRVAISWSKSWMQCLLRSSLWSWNMDVLRLHFVVSQSLTKANLVSQCYGYHILNVLLGSSHPWGNLILSVGIFFGPSRRRWGTNLNAMKKNRLTVLTCQCTTCTYYMPTRRPIHFGSTAWPRKTDGRRWWNQKTSLWRSTIHKAGQWCQKTERSNSQPHRLRSSWLVYGRNRMVFHKKPFFSTSEDRQAQGPQGVRQRQFERKSAHVTRRLRREDAQSAIHSP